MANLLAEKKGVVVGKLLRGAIALVGLAVAGVGVYRLAIGSDDGGNIVFGGIAIIFFLHIFFSEN